MSFYTKPVTQMPGGIPYRDERVPSKHFPGMEVSSEWEQGTRISDWRKKNPNVYPPGEDGGKYLNVEWIIHNQLRPYQKNRLGDNPAYFTDGKGQMNVVPIVQPRRSMSACTCGATETTVEYCKTCGGSKITGFKCVSCGKVRKS